MTCVTRCRSSVRKCNMNDTSVKLNHRRFRALLKKLRRKRIRQKAAQERDRLLKVDGEQEEEPAADPAWEEQERERQRQHELWLEREAEAQREFARRRKKSPPADHTEEVSKEDSLKQVLAQLPQASSSSSSSTEPSSWSSRQSCWHNPPAPPGAYRPPQEPCPFFLKTGACRFGDSCSRAHPVPECSRTLLLRGLYGHLSLESHHGDDALETDERELQAHFEDFFWDVLGELRRVGRVRQLRVCRNLEPHLRGNVYVQYDSVEEAQQARSLLNGRWYAGRPVSCEFSPVERWKTAICGLFFRRACPKGRNCNFLHVFRNPSDECWYEGRSPSPVRQRSRSPEEWGNRRRRRRSRSGRKRHGSAHRSRSRSRSRKKRHKSRSKSGTRSKKSSSRRRSKSRHR